MSRYWRPTYRSGIVGGLRAVVTTVSDLPHYRRQAERILRGPVSVLRADSLGTTYVREEDR